MHYIPEQPHLKHLGGNTIGGNSQTFYPELWAWMVKRLHIQSVFDVGCGEGHALREFKRLGCATHGIDGAPRNVALVRNAGDTYCYCHDLELGTYWLDHDVDLVWCCEVVAQVEERSVEHVLQTLGQGHYLAMTNELPEQIGHHHVNCQPTIYWMERLQRQGYRVHADLTAESKQYGHHFWSATGIIYERE